LNPYPARRDLARLYSQKKPRRKRRKARTQRMGEDLTVDPRSIPIPGPTKTISNAMATRGRRIADPTRKPRPARMHFRKIMLE